MSLEYPERLLKLIKQKIDLAMKTGGTVDFAYEGKKIAICSAGDTIFREATIAHLYKLEIFIPSDALRMEKSESRRRNRRKRKKTTRRGGKSVGHKARRRDDRRRVKKTSS